MRANNDLFHCKDHIQVVRAGHFNKVKVKGLNTNLHLDDHFKYDKVIKIIYSTKPRFNKAY